MHSVIIVVFTLITKTDIVKLPLRVYDRKHTAFNERAKN